ncbi:MAG: trypsin-like peptidase domain-containing protein [Thermoguttaceae bacterium]|nr:trypsin-like peptidase domain-containing protein [Thermoguttaceae bacterium]
MKALIDAIGLLPVTIAVLALQLCVFYVVFAGKAPRVGKALLALPALLVILLCAIDYDGSTNKSAKSDFRSASVNRPVKFEAVRVPAQERGVFQNTSNTSEENNTATVHLTGNTTLVPVAAPPAALASQTRTGSLVPVDSTQTADGAVRSAEYTGSGGEDAVRPAGFRASVPAPSPTDRINLNDESARSLMDRVSAARRHWIEETRPAVVHIEATVMKEVTGGNRRPSVETGGGVITKTARGEFFVITNNHVAGNAVSTDEVHIVLHDHRTLHPTQILSCPEFDIALLRLEEKNLVAAPIGDSDTVRIIDRVYAIGSPFGLEGSISSGIISGVSRRALPLGNKDQFQNFLQTDAAINPGNSGGPLLNEHGQVIGIVTIIATKSGASEGVGLAIPINHVRQLAARLIRDGAYKRPFIGLDLDRQFGAEAKAAMGLRRGAIDGSTGQFADQFIGTRVLRVWPNSPAEQAGVQEGDIIIACNGQIVEDGDHFNHIIGLSAVDSIASLDILRGSKRLKISPKLTTAGLP